MFSKLGRLLGKIRNAKNLKLVFRGYLQVLVGEIRFGLPLPLRPNFIHSAYLPDSIAVFGNHPETKSLIGKWVRGNRRNNAGDLVRYYSLILNLKLLLKEKVNGAFAELGVYKGNSAAILAEFAALSGKKLYLFDTFEGFDDRDLTGVDQKRDFKKGFSSTSIDAVRSLVGHPDHCEYIKGYFPQSITPESSGEIYAFVNIDCDLYKPMLSALRFFYLRLSPGGIMFLHDYQSGPWEGAAKAIDEFCSETGEAITLLPDKSGTAVIRKRHQPTAT